MTIGIGFGIGILVPGLFLVFASMFKPLIRRQQEKFQENPSDLILWITCLQGSGLIIIAIGIATIGLSLEMKQ